MYEIMRKIVIKYVSNSIRVPIYPGQGRGVTIFQILPERQWVSLSSLINPKSGRTNLPSHNPLGNSYDVGKELGANIFLLKFKQGRI